MNSTLILIAATVVVSLIAFSNPKWIDALILWPPAVERNNDYYRLMSYGFIHADMQHLLFNMITLYFFGRVTEQFFILVMGAYGFVLFYMLALIASIVPTYLKNRNNAEYRSLGASGAVSAVLFVFILMQPWATIYVYVIPVPAIIYAVAYVAYSIYRDRQSKDNINHSAHLWGAAFGVAFAIALKPALLGVFLDQLTNPSR